MYLTYFSGDDRVDPCRNLVSALTTRRGLGIMAVVLVASSS